MNKYNNITNFTFYKCSMGIYERVIKKFISLYMMLKDF